jgi:hypothetical protein
MGSDKSVYSNYKINGEQLMARVVQPGETLLETDMYNSSNGR